MKYSSEKQKSRDFRQHNLPNDIKIPVSVLSNRSLAALEAVAEYMKDSLNLTYHEIAVLLQRDDRTIWTCYHRAKIKRKKTSKELDWKKEKKNG